VEESLLQDGHKGSVITGLGLLQDTWEVLDGSIINFNIVCSNCVVLVVETRGLVGARAGSWMTHIPLPLALLVPSTLLV
jgi:hypothetical protein